MFEIGKRKGLSLRLSARTLFVKPMDANVPKHGVAGYLKHSILTSTYTYVDATEAVDLGCYF